MQSFRQYRRMRKDLQESIQLHGLNTATGDPHTQPTNDILEDVNDARPEKGIRPLSATRKIMLHDGKRVTVPGVKPQNVSETSERFDPKTLLLSASMVPMTNSIPKTGPRDKNGRHWALLVLRVCWLDGLHQSTPL
jgi:hypothetical protein